MLVVRTKTIIIELANDYSGYLSILLYATRSVV